MPPYHRKFTVKNRIKNPRFSQTPFKKHPEIAENRLVAAPKKNSRKSKF